MISTLGCKGSKLYWILCILNFFYVYHRTIFTMQRTCKYDILQLNRKADISWEVTTSGNMKDFASIIWAINDPDTTIGVTNPKRTVLMQNKSQLRGFLIKNHVYYGTDKPTANDHDKRTTQFSKSYGIYLVENASQKSYYQPCVRCFETKIRRIS